VTAWPWGDPEATRKGLNARIRNRYPADEIQLRLYEVAFRRLIARLEVASPGRWVIKGGVALLLRLDPNRASDDIDLSYIDAMGSNAVALKALERALTVDLGDFFSFVIQPVETAESGGEADATLPLRVEARIGTRPWLSFGIDLGCAAAELPTQALHVREDLTGVREVDTLPELRSLAMSLQLAQKVCAAFEVHGVPAKHSTRARDLVDIAMIARQVEGLRANDVSGHVAAEEAKRLAAGTLQSPLPTSLALPAEQVQDWRKRWTRATRGAPMSFDDACATAAVFLDPILGGSARGEWSPTLAAWVVPRPGIAL
jgi:Nucleotidyl transferase AbiEii toxin, Type IV TA system